VNVCEISNCSGPGKEDFLSSSERIGIVKVEEYRIEEENPMYERDPSAGRRQHPEKTKFKLKQTRVQESP